MAKAYHIYRIEKLPDLGKTRSIAVPSQLSYFDDMDIPDTTLVLKDDEYHSGYAWCSIHHEVKISQLGRAQGRIFTEYIRPHDFDAYIHHNEGIVAFQGAGDVVVDAVKVFNRMARGFHLTRPTVDLRQLIPFVKSLRGAWFKMSKPHLASQALFGDNVDLDPVFSQALRTGDGMRTMMLNYEYADRLIVLTILSDCGLVFYETMDTTLELDLLLSVKQSLIDLAIIGD